MKIKFTIVDDLLAEVRNHLPQLADGLVKAAARKREPGIAPDVAQLIALPLLFTEQSQCGICALE